MSRRTSRNGNIIRSSPLFPPDFWSVADNIDNAFPRTQNTIEKWHRRWETVVGLAHVSVFRIIQEIQKEQNHVQHEIESIVRGAPRPTQRDKLICVKCEFKQSLMTVAIGYLWSFFEALPTICHFSIVLLFFSNKNIVT